MFAVTKPFLRRVLQLIKKPDSVTAGEILHCKRLGYSAAICGGSSLDPKTPDKYLAVPHSFLAGR